MASVGPGSDKLAKLMSDHILSDIYRHMLSSIMNSNRMADEGWEDCEYGQYLSKDREFKIYVGYDEYYARFIVRSAIFKFFDRWANSGSEEYFDTVDAVITFLKGEYVVSAFDEIVGILEDDIDYETKRLDPKAYERVLKIVDIVDEGMRD